jgi:hypothetical protein
MNTMGSVLRGAGWRPSVLRSQPTPVRSARIINVARQIVFLIDIWYLRTRSPGPE